MPGKKTRIFRLTHLNNIQHIVEFGITHENSVRANQASKPIGRQNLIEKRKFMRLPNGRELGEYIPFYFCTKTPMLFSIQKSISANDLVFCVSSVQTIQETNQDFCFTDGHPIERITRFYFSDDADRIDEIIDWDAIQADYWLHRNDIDRKRKRQSEFLVLGDITYKALLGFVVYSEKGRMKLKESGIEDEKIAVRPKLFF